MNETSHDPTPTVQKKALLPPGVLPRHAQAWFIGGISILMILVIAFSGGKQSKEKPPAKVPTSQAADPNEQRIQEYRTRNRIHVRNPQDSSARNRDDRSAPRQSGALPSS